MTLENIIKKLSNEPEKFSKLVIKITYSTGEEGIISSECSNDPCMVWYVCNDFSFAPVSMSALIRRLKIINNENQKAEILQWQELSDEEIYD